VRISVARRGLDFFTVGIRFAEPQILLDGAVEQISVLMDDGDHPPQRFGIDGSQILAADPHRPPLCIEEAQQQTRDRGFARSARADDADLFAGGGAEGEPVMGGGAPAWIGEIDILEGDSREKQTAGRAPIGVLRRHQRFGGEERIDAGGGGLSEYPLMQHHSEIAQRPEYFGSGHQHDQQCLKAHQPVRHPPHGERQGGRGTDRDPAIGDAAGHHTDRDYPQ